ncbi:hypothetical protein VDGL01_00802 [Verticillium dahliae]
MYYDVGPVFLSPLHNPHPLLVQLSQDIRHQLDPNNGGPLVAKLLFVVVLLLPVPGLRACIL